MSDKKIGKLYIVGTPIGNMGDITLRALDTLKLVDVILAEDTRQTLKLLNRYDIKKSCISLHRHNEVEKIWEIKKMLDEGLKLALVSDAGMPRISDPGDNLVCDLLKEKYDVEVIPGVTALTTALAMSDINTVGFVFEGFLPMKPANRKEVLENMVYETKTIAIYEAPHKLLTTLKDLLKVLGDRKIVIARELTKLHEEYRYTKISEQIDIISKDGIKGEIVVLIEGNKDGIEKKKENMNLKENMDKLSNKELVSEYISKGIDKKEAIKKVAKERNLNKNDVYMECIKDDI